MEKIKHRFISLIFLSFVFSGYCFAITPEFKELFQYEPSTYKLNSLQNKIFERDSYSGIGAKVNLLYAFNENNDYLMPVGTTVTWQLYRIEDEKGNPVNQLLSSSPYTYQGEVGGCENYWSDGRCQKRWTFSIYWTYPCAAEGRYRIKVLYNGNFLGEAEFLPTRYKPFIYNRYSKETIKPKISKNDSNAEMTDVQIIIGGVAGREQQCIVAMNDAKIRFTNTIVEEVNSVDGHAHFSSNNEIGTGKYIKGFATDILNPDSDFDATKDTSIEGITNSNGFYKTKYQAGDFGIRETVTIEVIREATDTHPTKLTLDSKTIPVSGEKSDTYFLDIKAPSLIPMVNGNNDGEFLFVYGGSCSHDPTARWVISGMKSRLVALDAIYKAKFGHRLSFNDASLKFGGVIDNNTGSKETPKPGGRESICHVSHRRGVDIDVNTIDEGKLNIINENIEVNGESKSIEKYLNDIALKLGLNKIKEKTSIHYRHIGY